MTLKRLLGRAALVAAASLCFSAAILAAPDSSAPGAGVAQDTPIGSGPHRAVMEVDPSLPTHTLYHPADLDTLSPLPVVLWGNGACADAGDRFRWFLSDIASYGYVVIAIGPIRNNAVWPPQVMTPFAAGGTPVMPPGVAIQLAHPATHSEQLLAALRWAREQNGHAGGPLYHRLDLEHVAVMGQSCGGAQALEASADPAIRTTVLWNSGLFPGVTTMAGGAPLTKDSLKQLHGPIAYISGDEEDKAYVNANDDFDHITQVPVFRAYEHGMVHEGTYSERNGGEFAGIAVAWLNWQLKGDMRARRMFVGPDCGMCVNPHWVVHSKHLG